MWNKQDQSVEPDLQAVAEYVKSPLWAKFLADMDEKHQCLPRPGYSRCSLLSGWNYKYAKGGRALCTVYPMAGYFSALVAVGPKETEGAEMLMPACSVRTRKLYAEAKPMNNTRWLLLDIKNKADLSDLMSLISLRRPSPKRRGGR